MTLRATGPGTKEKLRRTDRARRLSSDGPRDRDGRGAEHGAERRERSRESTRGDGKTDGTADFFLWPALFWPMFVDGRQPLPLAVIGTSVGANSAPQDSSPGHFGRW